MLTIVSARGFLIASPRRVPAHSCADVLFRAALAALLVLPHAALAGPTGGNVVSGAAEIKQTGPVTDVNQSTQKAIINWQGFSIAPQETVNFNQPNVSSVTLNRVIGNERSVIEGALNANGHVFIVNSAGVLFSHGAQVNVGGLVASTLDIKNEDFEAGNYTFSGSSKASVINQGSLNAAKGGYISLLGNTVSNQGAITATLGTVALASGSKTTLNFGGNSLVDVTIDQGVLNALVENKQLIRADGGKVILTARAADALLAAQVNNTGIIQARTMAAMTGGGYSNGHIELSAHGGTTHVSGTLDASAPEGGDGGFIETSGDQVNVADAAFVTTAAAHGETGTWLIDPNDFTVAATGGNMTGAAVALALASNNFGISTATQGTAGGNGDIFINDAIAWDSNATLTLSAERDININNAITANGGLTLNAANNISAQGAITVGTFILSHGIWIQIGTLPSFNARDFRISGGTFIRALGGNGSVATPYQIADVYGLQGLGSSGMLSLSFSLANDIDASGTAFWNSNGAATPVYAGFRPIGNLTTPFTGTLAGLGHTISGLTINDITNAGKVGLIGALGNATNPVGTVRDLGLVNVNITGSSSYMGAVVGFDAGTISNVYATGTVSGTGTVSNVGGLVGFLSRGSITNSHAIVDVSGLSSIGGLVGNSNGGTITDSYAKGNVKAAGIITNGILMSSQSIGGLVGVITSGGTVSNSYATGNVTTTNSIYVGGLVGFNNLGTLTNVSASGNVTLNWTAPTGFNFMGIGGLVGYNNGGTITNGSAAGGEVTVTATGVSAVSDVGGLVGRNSFNVPSPGTITGSSSSAKVTGIGSVFEVGGLVGTNTGSTITNSTASGAVQGLVDVGGFVGNNVQGSTITGSRATGAVASTGNGTAGGFVGQNGGIIANSSSTGSVTGKGVIGGFAGFNRGRLSNVTAAGDAFGLGANAQGQSIGGGLAGWNDGSIDGSNATGSVSGVDTNGGLVGNNGSTGTVTNSTYHDVKAEAAAARLAAATVTATTGADKSRETAATSTDAKVGTAQTQAMAAPKLEDTIDFSAAPPAVTTVSSDYDRRRRKKRPPADAGADYGAQIKSIDVDGQHYDLEKKGGEPAPAAKP